MSVQMMPALAIDTVCCSIACGPCFKVCLGGIKGGRCVRRLWAGEVVEGM